MNDAKRIVAISGTSRPDNYTMRALSVVVDKLRDTGAEVTVFDARELELSFPGYPNTEDTTRLRAAVVAADGIVLATPEYHGTFAAMTKLVIENLGFPSDLQGKPVALLGVAAGRIGAIKSLEQLRGVCAHVGALVLPQPISIAGIRKVFGPDGEIVDEASAAAMRSLGDSLLKFIQDYVEPKEVLESIVRGDGPPWAASV